MVEHQSLFLTATKISKCMIRLNNYPHALRFVLDCYMTEKNCDKAVNCHTSTVKYVPGCYETQEMRDKAVNRCFFYLILFLIGVKLKKCATELLLKILF